MRAVAALASASNVHVVVVAAPGDQVEQVSDLLSQARAPWTQTAEVVVVAGGATRTASVAAALDALPDEVDVVLVHDAARPLVPVALVEAVDAAVRSGLSGVVPALPVVDTVKVVDPEGRVLSTPDRATLRAVQTPQGFRRDVLERAYRAVHDLETDGATDDAGLLERLGEAVHVIAGSEAAFKITTLPDLVRAEALLVEAALAERQRDG